MLVENELREPLPQAGIRVIDGLREVLERGEQALAQELTRARTPGVVAAEIGPGTTAADGAEIVLRQCEQAMKAKDIVDEMLRLGYETDATRPYAVISNALRSDSRFERLTRGIYGLQEWYASGRESAGPVRVTYRARKTEASAETDAADK